MTKQKSELGKGIRALLQSIDDDHKIAPANAAGDAAIKSVGIDVVKLAEIEVNPFQPRVDFDEDRLQDLAQSIIVHGLIQPITLRKTNGPEFKYQLISGERRLRASKMAGLTEVPAYIRTANDQEMIEMALIENIQREDLNAMEISINYYRLIKECSLTQEQLAERVGKDRSTVTNFLRLLKLPEVVQLALKAKDISMGHARALLSLENVDEQLFVFKELEKKSLSVRQLEQIVAQLKRKKQLHKKPENNQNGLPYEFQKIQDKLTSKLSTRVQLTRGTNGKGEINIPFYSDDDLSRLIELLGL